MSTQPLFHQIISDRQRQQQLSKTNDQKNKSFLDVLLCSKLDGGALKEREIIEELSTFIFTVSLTLTFYHI